MRVLDPFFFISSHGVGILFMKSISDVVSVTKRFEIKIKLKFEGSRVNKICYTSGNPG